MSARYRCLLCGRDKFTRKSPHNCISGFRKRGIKWETIESPVEKESKEVIEHDMNGDNHLSGHTRGLWMLAYSCLYKFGCPVIFKTMGPDVPRRLGQYIEFFVPTHHPLCAEVIEYLKKELEHEVRPDKIDGDEFWWGTHVRIHEYSGLDLYTEYEEIQKMAKSFMEDFMNKIKSLKEAN